MQRIRPDLFLFLKKTLNEVKARDLQLVSIYIDNPQRGIQKTN